MKKILLSCACCLLALGLVTACDDEVEEPEEPEVPGTVVDEGGETTYLFGFEIDGTLNAIDGGLVEYNGVPQSYEGSYTSDLSKAVAVSCESSGSTYYLSFENAGVTNWITIIQNGSYTNLSYATTKSPIYLHTTDGGAEYFGNEDGSYFLCHNSSYGCLYASKVEGYITSSPVAGLYTTDGKLVAGGVGKEPTEPVLGTVTEGEYFLGVTLNGVPYYFDGQVYSNYYAEITSDGWDAVVVTVAAVTGGYTLSFVEGEVTQYLNMTENNSNRNLKWGTEPFVWSYDTTYSVFVAQDSLGEWYFIGTYGTYVELALNAYGYLTGDKSTSNAQYPAELFDVITYNVPTAVAITGAENVESLEEGETLQLSATVTGTDPVNGKITWTSSNDAVATVSSTGLVTAKTPADSVTITATSAVNTSATASVTFVITEKAQGPVVADWQNTYESGATYKLAFTYSGGLRYADGLTPSGYPREGFTTSAFVAGADISVSKVDNGSDNEYYLTFFVGDTEYWITTVTSGEYINLSYSTTAASIFYNETYNCWGDSNAQHYLGAYYYSSGGEVYLYSQGISDVADTTKLPAQLYEWTGDEYGDYEVADFDALSSTGYNDTYSQNSAGNYSGYTILTGTTYEGFTACDIKWPEYKSGGSDVNNTRVNDNRYIQFYGSDTMTLTLNEGYTITRIEIACTVGYSKTWTATLDSEDEPSGVVSIEGDLVTITGTEGASSSIVLTNTSTAQARFREIVIYYA